MVELGATDRRGRPATGGADLLPLPRHAWHRRPEKGTPRLAGQARVYLHKQLDDFASGARLSDWMAPVARALSDEQRDAVAAYYASLYAIPYPEAPYGDPHLIQEARVLSAIEPVRISSNFRTAPVSELRAQRDADGARRSRSCGGQDPQRASGR
jgi:hypothetical protein